VSSRASEIYNKLTLDASTLLDYHPTSQSGVPASGRPPGDTGPLLRSTVVLLHTAWENYIENAVLEAAQVMLDAVGADHKKLPPRLWRALESSGQKNPWSLANEGWISEADNFISNKVARLNTPSCHNVDELVEVCLGISGVLDSCRWQNASNEYVRAQLDLFVRDVRGEIVHKGTTPGALNKTGVREWRAFLDKLVARIDGALPQQFETVYGRYPWDPVTT
jgi:hypothetical protein